MKTFKKVIALVAVIVCCFTICTSTAMAADTVTFSGETTSVRISRDCNVIRYTSGAKTIRPSTGFISLRFTSSTGSVHNYSFMVPKYEQYKNDPTKWGYIQCNLPAGTYTITKTGGTQGLIADINMSFHKETWPNQ